MKKNLTELVFILDRSGSMGGLETDTIGGFNSMIETQKKGEGEVLVSTVLFDHLQEVIHDRIPIEKVAPLTREQYYVRGSTALLDAVGETVQHISNIHKYIRSEDVPEHTLVVITTDGMENASRRYGYAAVKKAIQEKSEKEGWEFLFLGANIDAAQTAGSFGIAPERAADYHADPAGTQLNYSVLSDAITSVRNNAPLQADWKARIDDDYRNRKKRR